MITMFEEAYKKQPHHEELGVQTFFAIVRTGNWKAAQQVCPQSPWFLRLPTKYPARHENAQAVPRRSLHLLVCHQRCAPGESITQTCRIYANNALRKGQRSIHPCIYTPRALQTLASTTFLGGYPFPPFRRPFLSPPKHPKGTRTVGRRTPIVDNGSRRSDLRNQLDRGRNQEGGLETKGPVGGRETDGSAADN